jgi:hypothetical protein
MKTKNLFCANCQKETKQSVELSPNAEFVFTCPCERVVKFSQDVDFEKAIPAHEKANIGQVSMADAEKKLATL